MPSKNADLLGIVPISSPRIGSRSFLDRKTDGAERRRFRQAKKESEDKYTDSEVSEDTH